MTITTDSYFQYRELNVFLHQSPAVKLLRGNHSAMVIGFLYKIFRGSGQPTIPL